MQKRSIDAPDTDYQDAIEDVRMALHDSGYTYAAQVPAALLGAYVRAAILMARKGNPLDDAS